MTALIRYSAKSICLSAFTHKNLSHIPFLKHGVHECFLCWCVVVSEQGPFPELFPQSWDAATVQSPLTCRNIKTSLP